MRMLKKVRMRFGSIPLRENLIIGGNQMKIRKLLAAALAVMMVVAAVPALSLAEGTAAIAGEANAMRKLDTTWAALERAEQEAIASGMDRNKVINAVFQAATNLPNVDKAGFSDFTKDGFFFTVGHPNGNIKEATSGKRKCRIVSITNIEPLLKKFPYYSIGKIDMAAYPEATNASEGTVSTVSMLATFVTSATVPDDVVYAITKEVFANLAEFKKLHPALAGLTREGMMQGNTIPLHPGAEKYFKEAGLIK